MSLQLPPELAATVQGFLVGGRYENDEEVLREALVALKEREGDLLEGIEDEAAGRIRSWSEIKPELRSKYGIAN
jgi:Arc/MetJ-type ribon-helix-helix transcriptional regulator